MVKRLRKTAVLAVMLAGWIGASEASAQVFGTFSWRMEPYCNIITLTITQFPGGYTLDGHDNLCGAAKLAAATGQVLLNPDGTVGLNFTIVLPPSGRDVHVAALINPANGSGTWTDGVGNTGTFLLGAPGSGSQRPLPSSPDILELSNSVTVPAGDVTPQISAFSSPSCPATHKRIGGGAGWAPGFFNDLYLVSSQPSGTAAWGGAYRSERATAVAFRVFVICAR